jgi:hypothetical protein
MPVRGEVHTCTFSAEFELVEQVGRLVPLPLSEDEMDCPAGASWIGSLHVPGGVTMRNVYGPEAEPAPSTPMT